MTKQSLRILAAAIMGVVALSVARGQTAPFTSTLNAGNSALSGFPEPYGTVQVNLTSSTTAAITFTSNLAGNSGNNAYLFGDSSSVDLNINATSFTVGTVTGTNPLTGFTPGAYTANIGGGNVDGFGTFNLTIDDFDGFTHSANVVTFTVTDTSGTWSSASNVLAMNGNGDDAAAHIFVCSDSATGCTATGSTATVTGFAGEGAPSSEVPEPASVFLLGGALTTLGFVFRRKLKSC